MYKTLTICLKHLLTKNVVYLSLIYLNLIIHCYRLSAISNPRTVQTKCPSSSISFQLNRMSDQLIKQLTLNYSVSGSKSSSDRLVWKRRKRHSIVPEYMTNLYRNEANQLKYGAKIITSVTNSGELFYSAFSCNLPVMSLPFQPFFRLINQKFLNYNFGAKQKPMR